MVTEGYFEALGIPLLEGRPPERADVEERRPVAWVNETFARRFLGERALGKRLRIGGDTTGTEVVGVVGDVRSFGLDQDIEPWISLPMTTTAPTSPNLMQIVVRTEGEPTSLAPAIRAAVDRADPTVPLTTARAMDDVLASSLARRSLTVVLVGVAAGAALLLGVVGLYGVISYIVSLRTKEIGVRTSAVILRRRDQCPQPGRDPLRHRSPPAWSLLHWCRADQRTYGATLSVITTLDNCF